MWVRRKALLVLVVGLLSATACGLGTADPATRGAAGQPAAPPTAQPTAQSAAHRPAAMAAARSATAKTPRRPNLLVIETDDMRWDDLRFMPHVRRLIQRTGLSFENSFAPYPLCCPSRSSFLTGEYAHNHHVYYTESPFGFRSFHDRVTVATQLQKAGYQTALVGKYLNGYGQQTLRSTGRSSLHYVPPGWTQWEAGSDHLWSPGDRIQGGTYAYFHLTQNINGAIRTFPGRYSTNVLAREARATITRFSRAGKPWFVWFTPTAPHHGSPVEKDDPAPTTQTNGIVTRWDTPARPHWVKGHFDQVITHGSGTPIGHSAEADVSDKPLYLRRLPPLTAQEKAAETEVTRQRAEALYVLDLQVARTVQRLRQLHQLAHTVIAFTSDNGYYLGEHRKRQGKINLHEPSLRVPLLLTGPGIPHGRRYDPVTTVDLAPTLAAYAGTRMPRADGTDLAKLVVNGDSGWDRAVVTEAMMPERLYRRAHRKGRSPLNTRGLRLGRWKVTRYSTGEQELYDLRSDPLELHNLAAVPRYSHVLAAMDALYAHYGNCAGAACRAPLPAGWRLTPAQEKAITTHEIRVTNRYFGN